MKLFLIVLSTYAFRFGLSVEVIPQNCLIWGPGLISKANLPVRYFYIQARDKSGNLIGVDNIQPVAGIRPVKQIRPACNLCYNYKNIYN